MRFYTLSEVPPAGTAASSEAIRMGRVKIPAELDRSQLVQRIDANRLRIADEDRWAAPLEDMIRRVLAANLQARAGGAATSASAPTLAVEIDEFTADSSCAVTLRATWELKGSGSDAASLSTGNELIRTPASSSAPCAAGSIPVPMSQALAELADRIVAAKR